MAKKAKEESKQEGDGKRTAPPRLAKRYQEEIQGYLGQIGASVSRATVYNETLKVGVENIAAARAQITDADFASETAKLVSTQILQRATAAVLSQANQQPRLALDLLSS